MMPNPRNKIPQRTPIFLGCEGESERSYGSVLRALLEEVRQDRFLDPIDLGGGDPLALIERCGEHLAQNHRKHRVPYAHLALLLDSDQRGVNKGRDRTALAMARELGVSLIWQDPCHEAFLLRHFEGKANVRIASNNDAMSKLLAVWGAYQKGLSAQRLLRLIEHPHVLRAAQAVPEYGVFLREIGYLK